MRHNPISRRNVLCGGMAAIAAMPAFATTDRRQREPLASGRVIDITDDQRTGLPGVLVSNGVDITRTDAAGRYSLPFRDGIFVIKPAHWAVPFDSTTGVPHFAFIDSGSETSANSSPDLIDADFFLRRQVEPSTFSAALFADPQPSNSHEVTFLEHAINKMALDPSIAFGLALGDIACNDLSIYADYQKQIAKLSVPVWTIPGNHDHDQTATDRRTRLNTWRKHFGAPTHAFEFGQALFIMLDNVSIRGDGAYFGEVGLNGLTFLKNLLALTPQDKLVVVCTHIPLVSSHRTDPSCNTADVEEVLNLLGKRRAVSFSGHMHTSEHHYLQTPNGNLHHHQVIAALSGSWWSGPFDSAGQPLAISSDGTPHGWHVLSIEGTNYRTEFVSARDDAVARAIVGPPAAERSPASGPIEIIGRQNGERRLLVNVFDGGPRTSVYLDVGNTRHRLKQVQAIDPYVEFCYTEAASSLKHWVCAEASTHLWELDAPIISSLRVSDARLTVVDEFGRTRFDGLKISTT